MSIGSYVAHYQCGLIKWHSIVSVRTLGCPSTRGAVKLWSPRVQSCPRTEWRSSSSGNISAMCSFLPWWVQVGGCPTYPALEIIPEKPGCREAGLRGDMVPDTSSACWRGGPRKVIMGSVAPPHKASGIGAENHLEYNPSSQRS